MTNNITLLHGDCLELMENIPENSIDLIVIDPPYNIKKAEWDKIKNYVEWMGEVFKQCERLLKDNGSFYFFHNDFLQIVELQNWLNKNSKFVFKQLITWSKINENFKNNGFVQQRLSIDMMRNYYNGFTEYILFYTFQDETGLTTVMLDKNNFSTLRKYFKELQEFIKLNLKQINNILGHRKSEHAFYWKTTQWDLPTEETYKELIDKFNINQWEGFKEYESLRQEYESLRYTFNNQNVKNSLRSNSNTWIYEYVSKKNGHITPKPVDLLENILLHSSNEGYTVLDCFMGSGSTGIACINTNRNFIGIEKDDKYFEIAKKRIEEAQDQGRLL